MRKRVISVFLIMLVLGSSLSNATIRWSIPKNVAITTVKDGIDVYNEADATSEVIGKMTQDVKVTLTGNTARGWSEVESGGITGWVRTHDIVSGKKMEKYIKDHIKDYKVTAQCLIPTAVYAKKRLLADDLADDMFYAYVRLGKDIKAYKTKSTDKLRKDKYKEALYVKPKKGTIKAYRLLGGNDYIKISNKMTYKVLSSSSLYYGIEVKDKPYYVEAKNVKEVVEKRYESNIVNLSKDSSAYYLVLSQSKDFVCIRVDGHKYYIPTKEVDIEYLLPDESQASDIMDYNDTVEVTSINKDVTKLNGIGSLDSPDVLSVIDNKEQSEVAYTDTDNLLFSVDLKDAELMYVEAKEELQEYDNKVESILNDLASKDDENCCGSGGATDEDIKNNTSVDMDKRLSIISYALQFVGGKYKYGGESLKDGIDCSAYCMKILKKYGINIGRCTREQVGESKGKKISYSSVKPGDLIYYTKNGSTPYHVVMYLGKDKCVNASNETSGICISKVKKNRILCCKNYID